MKTIKDRVDNFFKWVKGTELVELTKINVNEDPVRPELDLNWRLFAERKIYGLKYEDNIEATANTFKYEDKVKKIDGGYVFCADKDKNNVVKFDGLYLKDGVETIQYSTDKTSEDETPVSNFFMKYCYFFDGKEYHRINSYNTNISKPYEEAKTCIKKSR